MSFGLSNIPATFQLYINKYQAEKLDVFVIVYLNDIFIYTNKKRAKHEEAVQWVLEKLQKYGLYTNRKKCHFSIKEIHFWDLLYCLQGYI